MSNTCCIKDCYNRGGRDKVSFHFIPTKVVHLGMRTRELSARRQREWMAHINRKNWAPNKYTKVCSDHFISGRLWIATLLTNIHGAAVQIVAS